MKDAKQQIITRLRAETDAIIQGGRRRLDRDVRVLNGLDDVMATADTPREDSPTPDEKH